MRRLMMRIYWSIGKWGISMANYHPSYVLPYIAGLTDGEGCITITRILYNPIKYPNRTPTRYQLMFRISMYDKEPLDMIADTFGGKANSVNRKDGKPVYQFTATDNCACNILINLEEYLVAKKELALLGMEYYDTITINKGGHRRLTQSELDLRESFYQRMQSLIHRHKVR